MKLKQKFGEVDLQRIKAAVNEAEKKISGEIVPVIVERSGSYAIANYKASLITGMLFFVLMIILDRYVIDASLTIFYDPLFIFGVVVTGAAIGALIPNLVPPLKRWLISRAYLDESCRQSAENAFLEEEIFNTRHRTGIMIFISFFEHEVIVMADRGISKVVEQKEWDHIVSELLSHIRSGNIVEGIEAGIRRCGEILLEKGFHKTADDINELRDDLRIN
ncbi:MAG: TPM domain-containing protein [Bacteroidota bacterium]|nr:TPM domain-containing protein [Bacteroidota bacterium]